MYEGLTLQFDSRKGTKNNKMKRFHPLKTKNESLCMGFAKNIECNTTLQAYLVFRPECSRFGGRGSKALRESLNFPVF